MVNMQLLVDPLDVFGISLPACCAKMIVNALVLFLVIKYVGLKIVEFMWRELEKVSDPVMEFDMNEAIAALAKAKEGEGVEGTAREDRESRGRSKSRKGAGDTRSCPTKLLPCVDPATGEELLCVAKDMDSEEVEQKLRAARVAHMLWRGSSFSARRRLLRVLLRYIVAYQREICEVAARDSGKAMLDAALGEVMTTCEKAAWLINHGEQALQPEKRKSGRMMFYKSARVEYHAAGVMAAIVPWNYPFHNVLNPVLANIFAGNAIAVKASEHASWSALVFEKMIRSALAACGAPQDLFQLVTGGAVAGSALVTSREIDKIIFVGSTRIGKKVQVAAAENLTPVVLELGGKDAVIICDDADMTQVVPTSLRAAYMSCGQNCAGGERFFVQEGVYDKFCKEVTSIAKTLTQGAPLQKHVDCGAMCMPGECERIHSLVMDAVKDGAKLLVGGQIVSDSGGQFYAPTIIVDVHSEMRIMQEEVFGPVMTVMKFKDDIEAVNLANFCPFGLGSAVFSKSQMRANRIAMKLKCGMTSINDFATTYMCQSLPFGGVKDSGYGRFAGVEGLRDCCVVKSVAEDTFPAIMDTRIPPFMQYPVPPSGFSFATSLIKMFYGVGIMQKIRGLASLLEVVITGSSKSANNRSERERTKSA